MNDENGRRGCGKTPAEVTSIRLVGSRVTAVMGRTAEFLQSHYVCQGALTRSDGDLLTVGHVKAEIRKWLAQVNLEHPAELVFATGADAANPHSAGHDNEVIHVGEAIICDLFPRDPYSGHFFDFTRTWCMESAPIKIENAYRDVLDAFDYVLNETMMHDPCVLLHRRACAFFEVRGHPTICKNPKTQRGFVHAIGHGIGRRLHEAPYLWSSAKETETIAPNCVVAIEPGLYYPGELGAFGVRIEDCFWMNPATERFASLAPYPKDLILSMKQGPHEATDIKQGPRYRLPSD
jgi:Xaa-Pro aminopeptidase